VVWTVEWHYTVDREIISLSARRQYGTAVMWHKTCTTSFDRAIIYATSIQGALSEIRNQRWRPFRETVDI